MTKPSWFSRNVLRKKPKPTGQEPEFEVGDIEANENVPSRPLADDLYYDYVERQGMIDDGPLLDEELYGPELEDLSQLEELANFTNPEPSGRPLQDLTAEQLDQLEQKVEDPWDLGFQDEAGLYNDFNAIGNEELARYGPQDIELVEMGGPEVLNPMTHDLTLQMDAMEELTGPLWGTDNALRAWRLANPWSPY